MARYLDEAGLKEYHDKVEVKNSQAISLAKIEIIDIILSSKNELLDAVLVNYPSAERVSF